LSTNFFPCVGSTALKFGVNPKLYQKSSQFWSKIAQKVLFFKIFPKFFLNSTKNPSFILNIPPQFLPPLLFNISISIVRKFPYRKKIPLKHWVQIEKSRLSISLLTVKHQYRQKKESKQENLEGKKNKGRNMKEIRRAGWDVNVMRIF